jgi:nucleoside-diphosphate-sugar epimerase
MKMFITGATGVIGRRAIPVLRSADHTITAAAHSQQSQERLACMGLTTVSVSLFEGDELARAFKNHNVVINLATHIPHYGSLGETRLESATRPGDCLHFVGLA